MFTTQTGNRFYDIYFCFDQAGSSKCSRRWFRLERRELTVAGITTTLVALRSRRSNIIEVGLSIEVEWASQAGTESGVHVEARKAGALANGIGSCYIVLALIASSACLEISPEDSCEWELVSM